MMIRKEEDQKEIILKAKEVIDDDSFQEVTRKKSRKSNNKKTTMVTKEPTPLQNNKSTYHVNATNQETSKRDTDQSIAPETEIQETNKEVQQLRVHNQQAKEVKERIEETRASTGPQKEKKVVIEIESIQVDLSRYDMQKVKPKPKTKKIKQKGNRDDNTIDGKQSSKVTPIQKDRIQVQQQAPNATMQNSKPQTLELVIKCHDPTLPPTSKQNSPLTILESPENKDGVDNSIIKKSRNQIPHEEYHEPMGLNTESDEESIEEDEEEYESIEDDFSNEEEEEDSEEETANLLLQSFTSQHYDQPEIPNSVD
ncbi:PREDICTED: DNA ligase 1-like [Nicotiana attenuata]|uniref:DNA ligase 1-like n=1 Tax=Nicotiana attenuata TaxID=49451 RepID=UPI000904E2F4|nr:PREDICTED: DNA ligase 1-like [Nicotiana attenuata]